MVALTDPRYDGAILKALQAARFRANHFIEERAPLPSAHAGYTFLLKHTGAIFNEIQAPRPSPAIFYDHGVSLGAATILFLDQICRPPINAGNPRPILPPAAISLIMAEVMRARVKHPAGMRSAEEGFAVILEETEELWAEIMRDAGADKIEAEAVQVGAMAISFAVEIGDPF